MTTFSPRSGYTFGGKPKISVQQVPGVGSHNIANENIQNVSAKSNLQKLGSTKRVTVECMILQKNTPGVGQYNPSKSQFETKKGPTMAGKHRPVKNMNPGPSDYDVQSLSPVRQCTIGNDKKLQLVVQKSKAPKKVKADQLSQNLVPSAKSFMHSKPAGT